MTRYLKELKAGKQFTATFTSGATTQDYDAACFFMVMQDKGVKPEDVAGYIKLGKMTDPLKPWAEIRQIAATFTETKPGKEAV